MPDRLISLEKASGDSIPTGPEISSLLAEQ